LAFLRYSFLIWMRSARVLMNFNPQQTLRNNHLFFGFGKSSRMLRHSLLGP
jgi:hypothetical protein